MNKLTFTSKFSIRNLGWPLNLTGIFVFLLFSYLSMHSAMAQSACITGDQTICAGNPVELTVSMTGTPAFSFVYTDGTNNYTVTGITSNTYVFTVTPTTSTNYSMVSMSDANGTGTVCPLGTPGHTAAITVFAVPTANLTSNQTVCQGNAATSLLVNFTGGTGPWKIEYTDGTTPVTIAGITSNPYAINITPTSSATYTLNIVSDVHQFCSSSGNSVTVFVQSAPTAVLSSDQTLCQDASLLNQTANLTINLTGAAPWNVTYSDGTNNTVISGISSSPFLFSVSPNHTTTYTVINVVDIFGCTATSNSSITVTVNYFPVPSLTASNTLVCNSTVGTTLSFNLVGNPNFILTYTDGTTSTTVTGISASPYVLHVSPTTTTTYWVTSLIDANNCPTNPNNNVSLPITVGSTPTVSLSAASSIICQNITGSNTIQLDFTITSGTLPWTLNYTDGTTPVIVTGITSSPYIVTVSPTVRTTYHSVSVTDALGCTSTGNIWILDPKPIPTAAFTNNQTICPGSPTALSISLTGTGPWSVDYSDGTTIFTVTPNASPFLLRTTVASNTTYTIVNVSDAFCSNTSTSTATVLLHTQPTGSLSANQTICSGATANLTFSLTGTAPWTLDYSDGTTFTLITGVTSNNYIIQVSPTSTQTYQLLSIVDGNGCIGNPNQSVVVTTLHVNAIISANQTICAGNSTFLTIDLHGVPNWDLTYSDGTNSIVISGISTDPYLISITPTQSTTYTLTHVVDGLGCSQSLNSNSTVTVNPLPILVMSSTMSSVCIGQPILIDLTLSGNQPWDLTYSDGTNSFQISGITSSPYSFSVTPASNTTYFPVLISDANPCFGSVFGNAPVVLHAPPTLSLAYNQPVCVGGALNISAIGYNTGSIFNWTGPLGFTSTSTIAQITNVALSDSGDYYLSLMDPHCGIQAQQSIHVTIHPTPVGSTAGSNSPICENQSLNFTSTNVSGATYFWSGPNGFTSSIMNPVISPATLAASGQYTLVISSAICASSQTILVSVTVNPTPTGILSSSQTICSGASANLTFSLTGSPAWTIDYSDGTTSIIVTGITSTNYIVQVSPSSNQTYQLLSVSDGNGCVDNPNQSVILTIIPVNATISSNQTICSGSSTLLTIDLDGVANWDLSYSDGTTPVIITGISNDPYLLSMTPAQTTTYTLTHIIDGLGCSQTLNSQAVITVNPLPSLVMSSATSSLCQGQPLVIDLTLTGNQPWEVVYSDGTTQSQITGITASPYSFSITPSQTTTYFPVHVIDNNACMATGTGNAPVVVQVPPTLSLTSNQPVCVGGVLTISVNGYNTGSTFGWSGPIGFNSTLAVAQIVNVILGNAGDYYLDVIDPICGSQPQQSVNIAIHPSTTGSTAGSNSPLCETQTLNLTSTNVLGATYFWSGPNGFTSSTVNPTIPSVTVAASGQYTLVISSAACATSQTILVSVTVSPRPTLTPGSNSPICQGSNLALTMHSVTNATSYVWNGPNGYSANASPPSNTNRSNAQPTFTGTYTITVNTSNCGIISDTIPVLVGVSPSNVTLSSGSPFCIGDSVILSANYSLSPLYGLVINWSGPSGYSHIGQLDTLNNIQVYNAGQYSATITSSVPGCNSITRTINIIVNNPASFICGSSSNPVCTGSALYLTSQGPAGTTVVWSGPASFNSTLFNPSRSNTQTTFQGIYTVIATIPGCGTTMCNSNVTVNTSTNNNSASSNSPVCIGNTLNLSSNNTQLHGVQFSWVGPNSFTSSQQYPTISNAQSVNGGVYTVTIWSPGCWTNTRTVTVAANDSASLSASWTSPVCSGSTLSLQGSGNNATGFNWSGPASFSSTTQNPTRSNMQSSFQGVYTLSATIPGCGMITTTTSSVTISCREGIFSESSEDDSSLLDAESEFRIWPNPANNGYFYFLLPQGVQTFRVFLVNSLGQKMEVSHPYILPSGESEWEVQIPSYLSSGKYLLWIESEHFSIRKSLLISRE